MAVPPLLLAFATWLDGRPWGSVGHFDLMPSFADGAPILEGAARRDDFALFARLPDGSVAGFWLAGGAVAGAAPVVLLESEGQHARLGDSLVGFLRNLANQTFAGRGADLDFLVDPDDGDTPDATGDLSAWLCRALGVERLDDLPPSTDAGLEIVTSLERWNAEREAHWGSDPTMRVLASLLAGHAPQGREPWRRTHFHIECDGDRFEARVFSEGPQMVPESAAIEPPLRALREAQAAASPSLGRWTGVDLALHADGRIMPTFTYPLPPEARR